MIKFTIFFAEKIDFAIEKLILDIAKKKSVDRNTSK